ncbi:tRNAHis guanylyltransferase-domain-containing protein [Paraphoma chrysanthemicola]|uniref:tRNA(His) guanylyltransferase n=1 Tax=Paraphoma chrysanthemicola TaxID=798071 RepID=A0A8K0R4X7_9PLEO|nr:tRNAHis guanylyltransferase-domain-containing protein [Paraphoma chrysanthemicola]
MANSKYEYVRLFEQPDNLLANTWIVVRIDGRGFSKLTTKYKFVKPNDRHALDLMNAAAEAVMKELPDLVLAYGNSDEYSFVFHKDCILFERRASKLTTTITSTFTSYYVFLWSQYFPEKPLTPPLPSFDGRAVCYPSDFNLRDYMSWRQVDCHINNLYNTTFWTLVQQGGMGPREAEQRLSGTVSADKNEILFKEFGINYNNEPECFKKGTVLYRDFFPVSGLEQTVSATQPQEQSPTIASPRPARSSVANPVRPLESAIPFLPDQTSLQTPSDPGPTFLSTTSTPSPPNSPEAMFTSALPNPLRSNPVSPRSSSYPPVSMPISPPSTVTSPMGSLYPTVGPKQPLPNLMPLPLSPPILKPSTKPPLSLNAPNPTTRSNFSPISPAHDFPAGYPIAGYSHNTSSNTQRPTSHSASASLTLANHSPPQQHRLKQRSPSQPHLPSYFSVPQQPPVIPLRISSIPTNNKTRKLSLNKHQSMSTLKPRRHSEEKECVSAETHRRSSPPRRVSPPLRTDKALPSPPMNAEEELQTRQKVRSSGSQDWSMYPTTRDSPPRRVSENYKRGGQVWTAPDRDEEIGHPGIAELPNTPARRAQSHTRLHSAPVSASLYQPSQSPDVQALSSAAAQSTLDADIQPTAPLKDSPRSKPKPATTSQTHAAVTHDAKKDKGKAKLTEKGGWAAGTQPQSSEGRPVQQSRTQRDKDRKKRSKAKILIEHVDIIRDEFWEKRPWILSGKTG